MPDAATLSSRAGRWRYHMRIAAIGTLWLLVYPLIARAAEANPERTIQAAYQRYYDALRHRDLSAAMALVDPLFTGRLPDGTVLDFSGQAENLKELLDDTSVIGELTTDIEVVQSKPAEMTVLCRCVLFYHELDHQRADAEPLPKPDSFQDDYTRDTWVETAQGWKLRSTVYLRNSIAGNLASPEPPPKSARLASLEKDWMAGNKSSLDVFWSDVAGHTPLIEKIDGDPENFFVTFLWRGDASTKHVGLQGGLPQQGAKSLARLADTDLWYLTEQMPKDSRGIYAFKLEGAFEGFEGQRYTETVPDPLNPRSLDSGSVFGLPQAPVQHFAARHPGVPTGSIAHHTIKSALLNEERDYGVYTPAGFNLEAAPHRVLVLFDGEVYGNGADTLVPAPTILDNLIAQHKIPATVLVLVNATSEAWRSRDLTCSRPFADFLAKELLPEVRRTYHVSADPKLTIIGGSSFGGLEAACAALMHPETFGNVLSMSGSYWYVPNWRERGNSPNLFDTGWVLQEYMKRPKLPLRFYMEVGRFEPQADQLGTNRHLRDILALKGYAVKYAEYDGGHEKLWWRDSLVHGLIALSGTK